VEREEIINITCPDCHGPITELQENGLLQYRCLIGHLYDVRTFLEARLDAEERALWSAVVALEQTALLLQRLTARVPSDRGKDLERCAELKREQAQQIRTLVETAKTKFTSDMV
jgi:two-component system chemotaxis response regulator CheB